MMKRRTFLGTALSAIAFGSQQTETATAAEQKAVELTPLEPLVWPVVTKLQPGIRSFAGHTDTVPDIVGRIGTPPALVIFTEGNHLMALLSDDVVGAFPTWAKSQPQYADLDLQNIVVVTVPQPVVVQMIRTGGIALGNLTLDVSRESGFYPDIVMGGPEPLRQLRKLGVIEPQARFFSKNRGLALLVRKGNPLGIHVLTDVARTGARIALPDAVDEAGSRARYRAAVDQLIGKSAADAFFCRGGAALSRSHWHRASRFSRDGRPRVCRCSPHAVSPHFLLDADIPKPLRARTRFGRGAVFSEDRLRSRG
jgi:hypothetical protein